MAVYNLSMFKSLLDHATVVHAVMVSANKIKAKRNAISALSNLIAELSLRTKWHTAGYT